MRLDKRFALLASTGDVLYPYQKKQRSTGRYGFALTTSEHGKDRGGGGYYTTDFLEAVQGVLFKGWGIRACTDETTPKWREGSYKLEGTSIAGYWLAPELQYIAQGALKPPVQRLPFPASEDTSATVKQDDSTNALTGVEKLDINDYVAALESLGKDDALSNQLSLLIEHAATPSHTLALQFIASRGSYDSLDAEREYEKLARFFVEHFSIQGLANPAWVLYVEGPREAGQQRWIVRPPLVEALKELGLLEGEVQAPGLLEAAEEVKADL